MRFYNYLHEDMDKVLEQGLENLQSIEISEEIIEVNEETKRELGGVFKSAGIEDKEKQMRATEVVFYTIIFGFAIHGGVTTGKALLKMVKSATLTKVNIATVEGVVTAVKSKEVTQFIKGVMRS